MKSKTRQANFHSPAGQGQRNQPNQQRNGNKRLMKVDLFTGSLTLNSFAFDQPGPGNQTMNAVNLLLACYP